MLTGASCQAENAAGFHTQVDDVFARIASRYDLLCDLFSFGIHRIWKRRVAAIIAQEPWLDLIDTATGTGDIVLRVLKRHVLQPNQSMLVSDISPQMLAIAQRRTKKYSGQLSLQLLDAESMPEIDDGSMDLFTMSLGLKICDRRKVLAEAWRVLRPGGRLILLEASHIRWRWLHRMYLGYMSLCMPFIGWIATGGDASAYRYLLQGIEQFPNAEVLSTELSQQGFESVSFERMTCGIVAIHVARKPCA